MFEILAVGASEIAPAVQLPPPLPYRICLLALSFDRQHPEDTGKLQKTCVGTVGLKFVSRCAAAGASRASARCKYT